MKQGAILVIDDNKVIRRMCERLFSPLAVSFFSANTAQEGLRLADLHTPDIILLDIGLPDENGFEVLKLLKNRFGHQQSHIIMLTSESGTECIVKALKEGASDYVKKPFAGRELIARVKNLLEHRQYERTIARDLATGLALQKKFLTPETDLITAFNKCGYKICTYNRSCTTISGDFFYPLSSNDNDSCGLFFADTCGHGLSAALISMRIIGSLHTMSYANNSPANHLQLLNEDLQGVLPKERFVAACYIFFKQDSMILSNAGQPYPILISGNTVQQIKVGGYPIGQLSEPWYNNEFINLSAGDRIVLCSDGLIEAPNTEDECFGEKRLLRILADIKALSLDEMTEAIISEFEKHCDGTQPNDDISLIILEKSPSKEHNVTIPNTQAAIGDFIEQFKKRVLQRYLATTKQQELAEYVLVECLDNAWEHGNQKEPEKKITVRWSVSVQHLTFSIKDQGKGFTVQIPEAMPSLKNPRGRGLFTLKDLTEELFYNHIGNKVTCKITRENTAL